MKHYHNSVITTSSKKWLFISDVSGH
jgi:WD40 repeat protein